MAKETLACKLFFCFLGTLGLYAPGAAGCLPAIDSLSPTDHIPQQVLYRFCNPEIGYDSLLLIQAAIKQDSPIFRVIAVKRGIRHSVQSVRLYQFDQDGNTHPDFFWQPQAVIDFKGNSPRFEAFVKGQRTTVSFERETFEFQIDGPFGIRIKQKLNAKGRITIDQKSTSIIIISTSNRNYWHWILDDGERVRL
jgi:hypothetical protein